MEGSGHLVDVLEKAIQDKYQAYYLYRQVVTETESPEWQKIIYHIVEDEKAHYEMFQQLYFLLKGNYFRELTKPEPYSDMREFLQQAWQEELEATDTYKMMVLKAPAPRETTPFWIAMHDEMEHAIRINAYIHYLDERS